MSHSTKNLYPKMRRGPRYKTFEGKKYIFDTFTLSQDGVKKEKENYKQLGYLVRTVKNKPAQITFYELYIRSPKTGINIRYDSRGFPLQVN